MFDIIAQGLPELAGAVNSGAQSLMDGSGIHNNIPTNQTTGVETIFNILETGIRLLIGAAVLGAVGFCVKGGIDLMRAGGSPQMMEKARNQIIFSGLGAAVAVGSFFFVGTVIDFLSGASGNAIVDPGDLTKQQTTLRKVDANGFLATYSGQVVLCPPADHATNEDIEETKTVKADGSLGDPEWKVIKAQNGNPAYCQQK